jgi:hypothetical protein
MTIEIIKTQQGGFKIVPKDEPTWLLHDERGTEDSVREYTYVANGHWSAIHSTRNDRVTINYRDIERFTAYDFEEFVNAVNSLHAFLKLQEKENTE